MKQKKNFVQRINTTKERKKKKEVGGLLWESLFRGHLQLVLHRNTFLGFYKAIKPKHPWREK